MMAHNTHRTEVLSLLPLWATKHFHVTKLSLLSLPPLPLGLTILPHGSYSQGIQGLLPFGVSQQQHLGQGQAVTAAGSLVPVTVGFPGM